MNNHLQDEVKPREFENQKVVVNNKSEQSAISQVLRCYQDIGLSQDLDIRKMVITPNGKYLITCSEVAENEKPKVCVWVIEKILERITKPEKPFLEGDLTRDRAYKINNWLLCVDAITTVVKGKKMWIVCAGSINGNIYIWSGDIDEESDDWNLEPRFFNDFSEDQENPRAIYDIKIREFKKNNTYSIFLISNNIDVISKNKTGDNFVKELQLSVTYSNVNEPRINFNKDFVRKFKPSQDEWILAFDLFINDDKKLLITGSNDNTIYKWDLEKGERLEPEIGTHEDGITCIKIFDNGNKLASGCLDNIIKVWDLKKNQFLFELSGPTKEIVSIDIQKNNEFLIAASKDNSIKIWDLDNQIMIRDIHVNEEQKYSSGLDFLRQILLSPNDQHIFAIKKNRILILRNYGRLWHFCEQLKYMENTHPKLYEQIYAENLKQIAEKEMENEESLEEMYKEIKKRLISNSDRYNPWKLGALFIPSFVKFEDDDDAQKQYIESVRTNYENYWFSANKMFHNPPQLSWGFKLFLTTNIDEEIENAKFIEITNFISKEDEHLPYIILKNRIQSQIRFLMVLDNVPTTFIPLLKAVILDVEDDRGDKDKLIFTDFKLSKENFLKILTNPSKSLDKDKPYTDARSRFFYSYCIFKLDERYSTEKLAEIFIRKKALEFTDSLNPLESNKAEPEDINLFEAYRNNFHSPITPKIHIQIGKGIRPKIGRITDNYLAGIVALDFVFTIISVLILYKDVFEKAYLTSIIGMILFGLNLFISFLIILAFILIFTKKGKYRTLKRRYRRRGIKIERGE